MRSSQAALRAASAKRSGKRRGTPKERDATAPAVASLCGSWSVVRDLDLGRSGFGTLRDREFEYAVLVRGLDRVVTDIAREPEGPTHSAVVTLGPMNPRALAPCRHWTLGADHQCPILDLHFERVALQPGQV